MSAGVRRQLGEDGQAGRGEVHADGAGRHALVIMIITITIITTTIIVIITIIINNNNDNS